MYAEPVVLASAELMTGPKRGGFFKRAKEALFGSAAGEAFEPGATMQPLTSSEKNPRHHSTASSISS